MNSIEVINELYKPYRITKKGGATILHSMEGSFVIKPKGQKDIKELFEYLKARSFFAYPEIVDASRSDVNMFEYIEDIKYPKDQKSVDLARVVAELHNKTSYHKEVREDKYKEIYENVKGNLEFHKEECQRYVSLFEEHIFMSPSEYLFIRNSSKILSEIEFAEKKLDDWYELVKNKKETRVSVVHNNLSLDHYLKGKKESLISWDSSIIDTPILDIYNFYKKEALNIEFGSFLKEYLKNSSIEEDEKQLLLILLCIPPEFKFDHTEFTSTRSISESLDYIFKTEWLVAPYYSIDDEEQ